MKVSSVLDGFENRVFQTSETWRLYNGRKIMHLLGKKRKTNEQKGIKSTWGSRRHFTQEVFWLKKREKRRLKYVVNFLKTNCNKYLMLSIASLSHVEKKQKVLKAPKKDDQLIYSALLTFRHREYIYWKMEKNIMMVSQVCLCFIRVRFQLFTSRRGKIADFQ